MADEVLYKSSKLERGFDSFEALTIQTAQKLIKWRDDITQYPKLIASSPELRNMIKRCDELLNVIPGDWSNNVKYNDNQRLIVAINVGKFHSAATEYMKKVMQNHKENFVGHEKTVVANNFDPLMRILHDMPRVQLNGAETALETIYGDGGLTFGSEHMYRLFSEGYKIYPDMTFTGTGIRGANQMRELEKRGLKTPTFEQNINEIVTRLDQWYAEQRKKFPVQKEVEGAKPAPKTPEEKLLESYEIFKATIPQGKETLSASEIVSCTSALARFESDMYGFVGMLHHKNYKDRSIEDQLSLVINDAKDKNVTVETCGLESIFTAKGDGKTLKEKMEKVYEDGRAIYPEMTIRRTGPAAEKQKQYIEKLKSKELKAALNVKNPESKEAKKEEVPEPEEVYEEEPSSNPEKDLQETIDVACENISTWLSRANRTSRALNSSDSYYVQQNMNMARDVLDLRRELNKVKKDDEIKATREKLVKAIIRFDEQIRDTVDRDFSDLSDHKEQYEKIMKKEGKVVLHDKVDAVDKYSDGDIFSYSGLYFSHTGNGKKQSLDYLCIKLQTLMGEKPLQKIQNELVVMNVDLSKASDKFIDEVNSFREDNAKEAQTLADKLDRPYENYPSNFTKSEQESIDKMTYKQPADYKTQIASSKPNPFKLLEIRNSMRGAERYFERHRFDEQMKLQRNVPYTDKIDEMKREFNTKLLENSVEEIARLAGELEKTVSVFQNNSASFKSLRASMQEFVNNKDSLKQDRRSFKNLLNNIMEFGKEYAEAHSKLPATRGMMDKRLRIVSRINEVSEMFNRQIDPYSLEGQRRRLAEKLINAQLQKSDPHAPERFNNEAMALRIDNVLNESKAFKRYYNEQILAIAIEGKSVEDIKGRLAEAKDVLQSSLEMKGEDLYAEFIPYMSKEPQKTVNNVSVEKNMSVEDYMQAKLKENKENEIDDMFKQYHLGKKIEQMQYENEVEEINNPSPLDTSIEQGSPDDPDDGIEAE